MAEVNTPVGRGGDPQPGRAGPRSHAAGLSLLVILVVAAVVRFVSIGAQSLSIDEVSDLRIAHGGITDIPSFGDGFPPLYQLLLHFLVPLGDLAGRILSAAFGVATVGAVWAWVRRVARAEVATFAAAIMALSPLAIHFSTEGRAYALTALLAAGSLWSMWVALEQPSTARWVRWGLISALGIYTHYFFALAVAGCLLVIAIEMRGRPSRQAWIGIITLVALAMPALALLPGDMRLQIGFEKAEAITPSTVLYAIYRLMVGFSFPPPPREVPTLAVVDAVRAAWVWLAVLVPVIGLLLIRGYQALSSPNRRRIITLCASGLILESLAIQLTGVGFSVRYFPWLLIPLAVWLAAGLGQLRRGWRWVSAAALVAVSIFSLVNRNTHPHYQVEDNRAVAGYLESTGAMDGPVLVLDPSLIPPIEYYLDPARALALPDQWDPEIGRLGYYPDGPLWVIGIPRLERGVFGLPEALAIIDAHAGQGELYSLIYGRQWSGDPDQELLDTLSASDGLVLVQSFAGLDVYQGRRSR